MLAAENLDTDTIENAKEKNKKLRTSFQQDIQSKTDARSGLYLGKYMMWLFICVVFMLAIIVH